MSKYHITPDVDPDEFAANGPLPSAEQLYDLRVLAGLSKHEAADSAGIALTTVSNAEDNNHRTQAGVKKCLLDTYRNAI